MDICSITVRNVTNAEAGRVEVLRRFVSSRPKWYEEYLDWLYNKVRVEGIHPADPRASVDAWFTEQGYKILKEHPFVSCEDGMYRVDVMYTICM